MSRLALLKVVKIAQTAFSGRYSMYTGALINGANMERFIRSQNVERFRRLLERVAEESDRQKIINLLAGELQKQKDAGDPR